ALASTFLLLSSATATADKYDDTIAVFRNAGQSAAMFKSAYGYAEFPTIGKGGVGVGGARGRGRVYVADKPVGETTKGKKPPCGAGSSRRCVRRRSSRSFSRSRSASGLGRRSSGASVSVTLQRHCCGPGH